jgi:hypothetical protein
LGKVDQGIFNQMAFDHQKQSFQVRKAKERGEEYLGQKEPVNAIPAQKRNKDGKSKDK